MSTEDGRNLFGQIDKVHLFGGRGFSLWDPDNMQHVYESGGDLEREAMMNYPTTFNGECANVTTDSPVRQADGRSDDMVNHKRLLLIMATDKVHMLDSPPLIFSLARIMTLQFLDPIGNKPIGFYGLSMVCTMSLFLDVIHVLEIMFIYNNGFFLKYRVM